MTLGRFHSSTSPAENRDRPPARPRVSRKSENRRNLCPAPLKLPIASPAMFDHEKLDVYQLELKFLTWVTQFLANLSRLSATESRELRQQLDRAGVSQKHEDDDELEDEMRVLVRKQHSEEQ
jgi:hypothetical protein